MEGPHDVRELHMVRLVMIAGAVCGLVALWLPGGAVRPDRPDLDVAVGVAGLVVAAALSFVADRRARVATIVLAALTAGWAGWLLTQDIDNGLPGSSTAVLTVAAVVVLAAVVAGAVRPLGRLTVAGFVVVLAAGAVGAGLVAPSVPMRSTEVAAPAIAPLAVRPGARQWTWRAGAELASVVRAGAGVVVATLGGEVIALEGAHGGPRWRYARPGAHVRALVATPDGATVVAAYAPGGSRDTGSELMVVLDAGTGAVLRESTEDDSVTDPNFLLPTDSVLSIRTRTGTDDTTVRGIDLRSGAELWQWSAPKGCTSPFFLPRTTPNLVLTTLRCADKVGVLALGDRTGKVRWSVTARAEPSDRIAEYYVDASPDGRLLSVRIVAEGMLERLDKVLRSDDGRTVTDLRAGQTVEVDAGPRPLVHEGDKLAALDPTTGDRHELDLDDCPTPTTTATTTTSLLRICDDTVVSQDFEGGKVSRAPVGWRGPTPFSTMVGTHQATVLLPVPGAVVVARAGDTTVTGYATGEET